jgi:hypothetical protein
MSTKTTTHQDWSDDKSRWEFINQWEVEEQSSDRMPANGTVTNRDSRPIQRSVARRQHQLNYKRWSQARSE